MGEYDSGPRPLPWPLLYPLVDVRTVEDDGDFPPSSFVWPTDPNERTLVPFWLSLNEYNVLGSTIDVGSDIAFGEDALRVVWLWMRNWRIQVPICDAVDDCITNNPATIEAIVNQLMVNATYNTYLTNLITTVSPPTGGNVYPPRPTLATPDPLCNASTYVVAQIRKLIEDIYDDLETLTAQEVLESLLGLFGWRSGPLYQLIGLLETADKTALLADYDAAAPELICALIDAQLDQAPIIAWTNANYPSPSVLGDAMRYAIGSTADDGKWSQWIAVGALIEAPDCGCGDGPRFLIINGLPDIFTLQTQTFVERDGEWDVWDIVSAAFVGAPFTPGNGVPYSNGTNFKEQFGLCIDAEDISGMVWARSLSCASTLVEGPSLSGSYQQIGTYSTSATTLKVRVKLSPAMRGVAPEPYSGPPIFPGG